MLAAYLRPLLLIFRSLELQTSRGAQNRAASLDNVGNMTGLHVYDILIQQTVIALFDPLHL